MSRYIDADAMKEWLDEYLSVFKKYDKGTIKGFVDHAPTIDIVRCKECKYYDKFPTWSACTCWSGDPYEQASVNDDDFCSYGCRKEE